MGSEKEAKRAKIGKIVRPEKQTVDRKVKKRKCRLSRQKEKLLMQEKENELRMRYQRRIKSRDWVVFTVRLILWLSVWSVLKMNLGGVLNKFFSKVKRLWK